MNCYWGDVKCADISSLDPSLYFDASVLFEDEVEEYDYEDEAAEGRRDERRRILNEEIGIGQEIISKIYI